MTFKFIVGIDVSKNWFNFCIMGSNFEIINEGELKNSPNGVLAFIEFLADGGYLEDMDDILLIMEHTGIYVQHLSKAWLAKTGKLCLIHSAKVSNLLSGLDHWDEKTDAMDARRLAEFAFRFADKIELWQAQKPNIKLLQALQRQRSRTNAAINLLEVPIKESKMFDDKKLSKQLEANHKNNIKGLKKTLKKIDAELLKVINSDEQLKKLYRLITSVEGVGPVTAREVIISTSGFEDFLPNQAKAYARYCGVVPLEKQSGKIKRKPRNSKRANKHIKTLMTMGATSLIGTNGELGQYYRRKIGEGKKHFSVINAMRNKMILRIFAVVRNEVMYKKNLNLSL